MGIALGPNRWWAAAQIAALAGLGALVVGGLLQPDQTLKVFWDLVLPLLPLSFIANPALWRGICPLATLNMAWSRPGRGRLPSTVSRWSGLTGVVLLAAIVPARKFLLQQDALAFLVLVAVVGALAVVLGVRYEAKAGFCNTLCPVLPVERLYGQRPPLPVVNPRCGACRVCTPRGCLDLATTKAIAQTFGPPRRTSSWINTAFGTFAAAFPGFVLGFGLTPEVPGSLAWLAYATVLAWSGVSYGVVRLAVRLGDLPATSAMPVLAGLAAGLYYWFAGATMATTLGTGPLGVALLRALPIGAVVLWAASNWAHRPHTDLVPRRVP